MKKIKVFFDIILICLSWVASWIIPRSENIWVFGGNRGKRFADNSRYMFIFCSKNVDVKCLWLSSDASIVKQVRGLGFESYLSNSFIGLYYGFRARWHIYDVGPSDTSLCSSIGARHFNMWHGVPIKNLEGLYTGGTARKVKDLLKSVVLRVGRKNKKIFMAYPNREYLHHYVRAFSVPLENIVVSNQPRNVVFEDNFSATDFIMPIEAEVSNKIQDLKKSGTVIGYFPTWRSNGQENFMGIDNFDNLEELNSLLAKYNAFIVTKRHTCSFKQYGHSGFSLTAEENQKRLENLSNFITLDYEVDLNSLIREFDMLISDYSGAIIDYLLADKPQILYCYDLETYKKEPGLYFDLPQSGFGHVVLNMKELIKCLESFFLNRIDFSKQYVESRQELRSLFFHKKECFSPIIELLQSN